MLLDVRNLKSTVVRIVVSQWGAHGEYIHREDEVPDEVYGTHRDYYSERRTL